MIPTSSGKKSTQKMCNQKMCKQLSLGSRKRAPLRPIVILVVPAPSGPTTMRFSGHNWRPIPPPSSMSSAPSGKSTRVSN